MRGRQREIMNRFLKETENKIKKLDPQRDAEQIQSLQDLVTTGRNFSNKVIELNYRIEDLVEDVREDKKTSKRRKLEQNSVDRYV